METSIRADLFFGTAYGLALSAVLWTVVLSPLPTGPAPMAFLAFCAAAGALRGKIRWLGRLDLTYVAVLAGLLLYGPGVSMLAGLATTFIRHLGASEKTRRAATRHTALDLSVVVLAAAGAGAAYVGLGGTSALARPFGVSPGLVVVHAGLYSLVFCALVRMATRLCRRRRLIPHSWKRSIASLGGQVASCPLALGLAWIYRVPEARLWLLAAVLLLMTLGIHRVRQGRNQLLRRQRLRDRALCNSVVKALAKTMEAKDAGTLKHLRRVQRLCLKVGSRLGLSSLELEAMSAAALLHDIGKVAVPEGILTKPGRLTTQEMAQIRVHPVVGAEILQGIPFPFPLVSIVRHHHERWDGRGYPDGLVREEIPLGARLLAAVDSYDALTSDRPYRRAVSHDDALGFLRREAGRLFDPRVVEVLIAHLQTGEALDTRAAASPATEPIAADGPGEEQIGGNLPRAQLELQTLYEISSALGYGLSIDEYLTLVACKLARLVPYQSLVAYFLDPRESLLRAGFAMGKASDKLRLMTIPLGERLSGWAALQQRAVIGSDHRSPLDRDGSRSDLEDWSDDCEIGSLGATLVAPMVAGERKLGVLTLYDQADRCFTADDRRILIRVAGYVAQISKRLGKAPAAAETSLTDPLTGVPNARFLWIESSHRMSQTDATFGLLAFRVSGMENAAERLGNDEADRLLCQIARRFAACCQESETLVRFGQNLFIVLTPVRRSGDLVERWHDLASEVEQPALPARDGVLCRVRLSAAHASYPADGQDLEGLLAALDTRLSLAASSGRTILPFRASRPGASEAGRPA